ncbi:hypothetical protein GCM10023318_10670 [Nocardia callitridis]|uniref:Uncharacterized protein n=1 Tax=Nocardia callitridis TaxID=648753 RepID=A0ABP9JXN9_9NOCA
MGPRPLRFWLVAFPPLSLEHALANGAVSRATEATASAALGTIDERRVDTFFTAIARLSRIET